MKNTIWKRLKRCLRRGVATAVSSCAIGLSKNTQGFGDAFSAVLIFYLFSFASAQTPLPFPCTPHSLFPHVLFFRYSRTPSISPSFPHASQSAIFACPPLRHSCIPSFRHSDTSPPSSFPHVPLLRHSRTFPFVIPARIKQESLLFVMPEISNRASWFWKA